MGLFKSKPKTPNPPTENKRTESVYRSLRRTLSRIYKNPDRETFDSIVKSVEEIREQRRNENIDLRDAETHLRNLTSYSQTITTLKIKKGKIEESQKLISSVVEELLSQPQVGDLFFKFTNSPLMLSEQDTHLSIPEEDTGSSGEASNQSENFKNDGPGDLEGQISKGRDETDSIRKKRKNSDDDPQESSINFEIEKKKKRQPEGEDKVKNDEENLHSQLEIRYDENVEKPTQQVELKQPEEDSNTKKHLEEREESNLSKTPPKEVQDNERDMRSTPDEPKDSAEENQSEGENQTLKQGKESQEELQILDVHQYFRDGLDLKSLNSLGYMERLYAIHNYARTFESKVNTFEGEKSSLEYFVLDEKLMCLIEYLDKMRTYDDPVVTQRKIKVIEYIKYLQEALDKRAKDD